MIFMCDCWFQKESAYLHYESVAIEYFFRGATIVVQSRRCNG